jgi:cysteinyl-tRNA synthetase
MGIPTVDAARNKVPANRRKKMFKDWEKQKARHEKWLATQQAG